MIDYCGKLTERMVEAETRVGQYVDGRGLMLVIGLDGSRRWVLRIQRNGQRRDFGLGPVAEVSLAEARERAAAMRRDINAGKPPVARSLRGYGKENDVYAKQDDKGSPKLLVGLEEASKIIGIGRSGLYNLLCDGQLRSVRIGRRRLIPVTELHAFVEKLAEASRA